MTEAPENGTRVKTPWGPGVVEAQHDEGENYFFKKYGPGVWVTLDEKVVLFDKGRPIQFTKYASLWQLNPDVRCAHCRSEYNLGHVETIARHADCTVFKAPCCGQIVDDRRWKTLPSFTYLRDEVQVDNGAYLPVDPADI